MGCTGRRPMRELQFITYQYKMLKKKSYISKIAACSIFIISHQWSLAACESEMEIDGRQSVEECKNGPAKRYTNSECEANLQITRSNANAEMAKEKREFEDAKRNGTATNQAREILNNKINFINEYYVQKGRHTLANLKLCIVKNTFSEIYGDVQDAGKNVTQGATSSPPQPLSHASLNTAQSLSQTSLNTAQQNTAQAETAAAKHGKRRHNPLAEAHQCLKPDVGGLYGGFTNSCPYKVHYEFCSYRAKQNSWGSMMDCERKQHIGAGSVGPNRQTTDLLNGAQIVYWFACKDPYWAVHGEFIPGKGIVARCSDPSQ